MVRHIDTIHKHMYTDKPTEINVSVVNVNSGESE